MITPFLKTPFIIDPWLTSEGGGDGAVTRNFTTFDSTLTQYIDLDTELTITGDFHICFNVMPEDTGSFHQMISGTDTTINITSADKLIFFLTPSANPSSTASLIRGEINRVVIDRTDSDITFTINGAAETHASVYSGAIKLSRIGSRVNLGTASPFDGVIYNVEVSAEGVDLVDMLINEDGSSNTVTNAADGSNNGTRVNMSTADVAEYEFDDSVSPNTWTNTADGSDVMEVAGT